MTTVTFDETEEIYVMPNPLVALIHSRKFWLMVADALFALVAYFIGKYAPGAAEDVKFLTMTLQPVIIAVIVGITIEDAARHLSNR